MPNSQNRTASQRERRARNFVKKYGHDGLAWLIDAVAQGKSGQEIANRFKVSRERVYQWRTTFGEIFTEYRVHEEVQRIADETDLDVLEGGGQVEEDDELKKA